MTATEGWDTYWRGAAAAAAYSAGGIAHPAILAFWGAFFGVTHRKGSRPRCLDVASGSGGVVADLYSTIGTDACDLTCVDVSRAAVQSLTGRFPEVAGIVADAAALPLDSGSFDVVTSQFGVEYAGRGAASELGRVLAPGGRLAMIAHCRHGRIYRECEASLDAIRRTRAANFLPLAMCLFEAGFAAVRGAERERYEQAGRALNPAVRTLEKILQEHGREVAGGTIARLYDDVARIHENMPSHDPAEVLDWLRTMDGELEAFAARMASMCESALDQQGLDRIVDELGANGVVVDRAEELLDPADGSVLAWSVVAQAIPGSGGDADQPGATRSEATRRIEWAKEQLGRAVDSVLLKGVLAGGVMEAKPEWSVPDHLVIGKLREPGETDFLWVIGGDFPHDYVTSAVAATPREAARHFVLKWQLDAARAREATPKPESRPEPTVNAGELERSSERLFQLVRNDGLWPPEQARKD
ncbi:MAG TPA: DUF4826 family protein [Woeseiaceae bacterium]|nr:DUF4826 family protein [Woeseiaceae bacterium]